MSITTLLVPTDFSRAARNAVNYAAHMAKAMDAKLVLYHVYSPPVPVSEVPMVIPLPHESEVYVLKKLNRIKRDLLAKKGNKNLEIETHCACGMAVDEIYLFSLSQKADFIIMGMEGAGFFKKKIIGSTTTSLIRKSQVPVLSIHRKVKYKSIKRIVFASDNKTQPTAATLHPLAQLRNFYNSHVYILNVITPNSMAAGKAALTEKEVARSFEKMDHSIHHVDSSDVVSGVNDFVALKKLDMVVMIPHHHTWLERMSEGRQTKKMAFNSTVPLLTLCEKK